VITEKIIAEDLAKLFRNNIWKLYRLPESVILDRGPQFVAGLMKKLCNVRNKNKVIYSFLSTDR